jgi:transcriptional regulator with XRE-family HTH domain
MNPINDGMYEFNKEALIEIRKLMSVSQGKMAELLGVPPNTLSRWETGVTVPDGVALAAIYSIAKEHGVTNPPPFFAIRKSPIEINISSKTPSPTASSLSILGAFQGYLQTHIESSGTVLAPIVRVKIKNTAPETGWPKVVFMGVSLEVANTGRGNQVLLPDNLKTRITRESEKVTDNETVSTPWQADSKRQDLLFVKYSKATVSGYPEFPDVTSDESKYGEVLFPGQSVIFEMDVSSNSLPYLQLKVEGTISRRHLFHYLDTFVMPENITKPLALAAFTEFNKLNIYEPLEKIIDVMPTFESNTSMKDIHVFYKALSDIISKIKATQERLNEVFRQNKVNWFQAHVRAAYIYLDRVSAGVSSLKQSIEANDIDKISAAMSAIKPLKTEADLLKNETKELMRNFNISEEELNT